MRRRTWLERSYGALKRGATIVLLLLVLAGAWLVLSPRKPASEHAGPATAVRPNIHQGRSGPVRPQGQASTCNAPAFLKAASRNTSSATTLAWRPFGREETGWAVYEPLIEHEVGTACPATSPGFAERLGAWQEAHGIPATGELDAGTFSVMLRIMHGRRPFVGSSRQACPDPPDERTLATVAPGEGYGGKVIRLEDDALTAYRRMRAAFRREVSPADPQLLTLFSGFRSPADDQARCERTGACGGPELALCSAHRTGRAMDLYLGFAPGYPPDSSADPNRLFQSRTAAYRWLVARGGDFGLQPYPFEPWHWEYVGQP